MNDFIEKIYKTRLVHDESGKEYELHSEIDPSEGELLHTLISSDQTIRRTLEVGCAYGLSSLHICSALSTRESARHVIIDPVQHTYWHGVGVYNLKQAGFHFFELIERPSEFILPELAQREPGTYDLAFIDGVHTFDHTLLDFFYANHLIRIGGYIVLDDCTTASISRVVSYVSKYPCYRLLPQWSRTLDRKSLMARMAKVARLLLPASLSVYLLPKHLYDRYYSRAMYPSMVVLKKMDVDERNSDWFADF